MRGTILVTGACGFIGRFVSERLLADGWLVRGSVRVAADAGRLVPGVHPVPTGPIGPHTDWSAALSGVDCIVHLAARVHVMRDETADPLSEFRTVNADGTETLARQAARAGVRRFVFLSTIGVHGDSSESRSFTETDAPAPYNPYSVSKLEAEQRLGLACSESGLEAVILRPPLVYGPGNPGNFLSLLRLVSLGLPLPLALVKNRRSFIYVGNLVDAIARCAIDPRCAGELYLVSDARDVSTGELIRLTAKALGVPVRLLAFPMLPVRLLARIAGKEATLQRLTGSLTVDTEKIRSGLGWEPPFSLEQGLKATAAWYNTLKA